MSQIDLHIAIQNWNLFKDEQPAKAKRSFVNIADERDRFEGIVTTVVDHYGLTVDELRSKNRRRHIVKPRQIAIYLGGFFTKLTLTYIGEYFGKDHTTILHSINTVKDLLETDPDYVMEIKKLKLAIVTH